MSMILTEATQRFFPNLEEIPEESRCSTIMKERKEEEEGENDILSNFRMKINGFENATHHTSEALGPLEVLKL